jgi:membrane protein YqaA with SNARE-associated domain
MEGEDTSIDALGGGEDVVLAGEQRETVTEQAALSRRLFLRIFTILVVIAVSATVFVFRDQVAEFETYGYLGAFLIAVVTSATIILPVPGIVLIGALGSAYNPFLIGLAAGAGSALGELTGYMAGFSGQVVFEKSRFYPRLERWMRRRGFIAITVFSFVPNPFFDVAGATAGALRFSLWKFLLACFVGKAVRYILLAWLGWYVTVSWF